MEQNTEIDIRALILGVLRFGRGNRDEKENCV